MPVKASAVLLSGMILLFNGVAMSKDAEKFSPRLAVPRVAPIARESRTPEQESMLASRPDYNIYKTLAHHPELYTRWSGLGQYLLNGSTLPPHDRELIILRMGWLCQAPYEWSQHARIAKADVKLSDADVHRIAEGPTAQGWTEFDRTLLTMVDELRYETVIGEKTWQALRARYSIEQTIDALYTAAQYQLVSMALNSLGVQLDPMLQDRIPTDVSIPTVATRPSSPRPSMPRVKPLALEAMTDEQRALVKPQMRDGQVPNLYATLVTHVKFYEPRRRFGSYVQRDSHLPAKTRELLILRTAWLNNTAYEWAHHVPYAKDAGLSESEIARIAKGASAQGWSEEQIALLNAADELRRETFIADATWKTLNKYYTVPEILEVIYTVGGYAMTGDAINSLGIQLEAGYSGFPSN
jgi:4-carboxymuconolactone decarboxylase